METTHAKNGISKSTKAKGAKQASKSQEEPAEPIAMALEHRIDGAREMIEDLRERAEMAVHDRPYLVPVAAGAIGLGVGVLIGSRMTRIVALTAAGALMSDTIRGELAKLGRDLVRNLAAAAEDTEDTSDEDGDEPTTSTV